jgi:hypothetical protein
MVPVQAVLMNANNAMLKEDVFSVITAIVCMNTNVMLALNTVHLAVHQINV